MATKEAQTLLEKKRKEFQDGYVQNKGTKTERNSYPARRAKLLTSCKEKMMEVGNTGAKQALQNASNAQLEVVQFKKHIHLMKKPKHTQIEDVQVYKYTEKTVIAKVSSRVGYLQGRFEESSSERFKR